MLKKEHIRQVSSEKVVGFTKETFARLIKTIDESDGYLNDIEKVASLVLLSKVIYDSGCETIGEEGVELILESVKYTKEKDDGERSENN